MPITPQVQYMQGNPVNIKFDGSWLLCPLKINDIRIRHIQQDQPSNQIFDPDQKLEEGIKELFYAHPSPIFLKFKDIPAVKWTRMCVTNLPSCTPPLWDGTPLTASRKALEFSPDKDCKHLHSEPDNPNWPRQNQFLFFFRGMW